jgi:hypothetical protein
MTISNIFDPFFSCTNQQADPNLVRKQKKTESKHITC